ncbi:carboxynorspermidine decarboxylase [Thiocystis violacea]|uniref:carboxynorspermidine decarboxylase n=1 Tax=Thiocystis violacea TaxID=13725 RepID=UPI001903BB7C|nr:carboxynorspermidine decarboxylase [Thiocystis violacea]MBK1717762.1 carboxynorspermidine decarboxylase [Thiocystis violacea]
MKDLPTPYYLIDETRLQQNLEIIQQVRERSGAKSVLALKCFSTWCVFDLMRQYLDGTTSSSLFEARLGHEEFGKEVHAYSVGFSRDDVRAVREFADKIIFNSLSQLNLHYQDVSGANLGLRVNPGISHSHFDLADPARRYSRLGVTDRGALAEASSRLKGLMFHFNCENDDVESFVRSLNFIGRDYGDLLRRMEWVSLGGGLSFTKPGYPLEPFCAALRDFAREFDIQVYLEPGEAAVTQSTELVTTVIDLVHNEVDIAIIDASLEAHMLDHLVYRTTPAIASPGAGEHPVMIAGRTCLAGDVFGEFRLAEPLEIGREVRIADAGGYTMVKTNWFNGVAMPSIVVRRLNGTTEIIRSFGYEDFKRSLS